jgi:hypothetical protein
MRKKRHVATRGRLKAVAVVPRVPRVPRAWERGWSEWEVIRSDVESN